MWGVGGCRGTGSCVTEMGGECGSGVTQDLAGVLYMSASLHSTQSLWKEEPIASMGSRTFTDCFVMGFRSLHLVTASPFVSHRRASLVSGSLAAAAAGLGPPAGRNPSVPLWNPVVSGERAQRKAAHCFHVDSVSSSSVARLLGFPVDDGGALSPLRLGLGLCPQGNPALGQFHLFFYCMLVLLKCILHSIYTCIKPVNLKCIQCCMSIVSQ